MGYQNFFATKLFTDIGATDTTITLETIPIATSGRLVLEARNPTQREIIKYTGISGNQITGVLRAQGGTTAKQHLKNSLVEMNATAQDLQDLYDAFDNFLASEADGWVDTAVAPLLVSTNGNRSFDISLVGDKTSILSPGMRLKIPRTGTTPTQSADFNGTTQYASKATPTGITFTDDFTVEAWVNIDSYKDSFILSRTTGSNGFYFQITTLGTVVLFAGGVSSSFKYISSTTAVPLGKWVHIAATLDLSSNAATIYMDGVAQPSTITGTATSIVQGTSDLRIGNYASTFYLDGRVSDVRLWSGIRTDVQIRDNMNQQLIGSESGLIGYWKLNGNFNDSSSNANNLAPIAGAVATYADSPFNANAYAIVMSKPVFAGGNTTMTVQTPIGYSIPNQTLGTASYSSTKVPFGFPAGKEKWSILVSPRSAAIVPCVGDVWVYSGVNIYLPKGNWALGYSTTMGWTGTAASYPISSIGLSTSTTSISLIESVRQGAGGNMTPSAWRDLMNAEVSIDNTVHQTYNVLLMNHRTGSIVIPIEFGASNLIYAEVAYL